MKSDGIKSKSEDSDTRKPPPKPPEPSLEQFMMNLFPMIDKQHEILEGLQRGAIYDFFEFSTMSETDITGLTKIIHSKPEPLGNMSTRRLISLSRMITLAQINNIPDSHLASSYTRGDLGMFMKDENDNKRAFVAYTTSNTMTPSFTPGTPSKSPGEKRYEAWTRRKSDKAAFDILKEDKHYSTWKQAFEAEIDHQKMSRAIDPNFDETTLTCSFERQLWKEQKAYLWTILLTVWKNPLGKACISDFIKSKEAQKAYVKQ